MQGHRDAAGGSRASQPHLLGLSPVERKALADLIDYEHDRLKDRLGAATRPDELEQLARDIRVLAEMRRGVDTGTLVVDGPMIARLIANIDETMRMIEEDEKTLEKIRAGDRDYMFGGASQAASEEAVDCS